MPNWLWLFLCNNSMYYILEALMWVFFSQQRCQCVMRQRKWGIWSREAKRKDFKKSCIPLNPTCVLRTHIENHSLSIPTNLNETNILQERTIVQERQYFFSLATYNQVGFALWKKTHNTSVNPEKRDNERQDMFEGFWGPKIVKGSGAG